MWLVFQIFEGVRTLIISFMFLACTQLHGQERFYNFVEGWINNYSVEFEDSYWTLGLSLEGGSSEHNHIYYRLALDGTPIDSSYFGVDSLYTTTLFPYSSSSATMTDDAIIIAGYGGNVAGENTSYGILYSHDFLSQTSIVQSYSESSFTTLDFITQINDSTYLVSGTNSDNGGFNELFIFDLDIIGSIRWEFSENCGLWCESKAVDIEILSDGALAVLYYEYDDSFPTYEETLRTVLLKLNAEGEELWRRYPGDWEGNHIDPGGIVEVDGEILISYTDPYFYNADDQWDFNDSGSVHLARYDLDGNFISEIDYMNDMYNNLDSARVLFDVSQMQRLDDGNILISGSTGPGGLMMKIDPNGDLLWFREHLWHPLEVDGGFSQDTWLYHVLPTSDGGFLGTGEFRHSPTIEYPFSIQTAISLKVDDYGCLEPGCQLVDGLEELAPSTGSGTSSLKVWPNPVPAGASASLSVRLPEGVRASDIEGVEMRDEMGRQMLDSKFKIQDEGIGTLGIASLPSGIYFLQLVTYEQVYSAKVVKE